MLSNSITYIYSIIYSFVWMVKTNVAIYRYVDVSFVYLCEMFDFYTAKNEHFSSYYHLNTVKICVCWTPTNVYVEENVTARINVDKYMDITVKWIWTCDHLGRHFLHELLRQLIQALKTDFIIVLRINNLYTVRILHRLSVIKMYLLF